MEIIFNPLMLLTATAKDFLPVLGLIVLFQTLVLKKPIPRPGRIIFGFGSALVGMTCFLGGLDLAIFPIGITMPLHLAETARNGSNLTSTAYGWVYLFAFLAGFATTDVVIFLVEGEMVEPVLSAIKEAGQFSEPGTGIAFVLAVEQTAGFESQLSKP